MAAISLDDAKQFLNITGSSQDAELLGVIYSAQSHVERLVGPLSAVQVSETHYEGGNSRTIPLNRTPVLSVQSVGVAFYLGAGFQDDTASWILDPVTGVLHRTVFGGALGYYGPGSVVQVSYTVGRSTLSEDLTLAVKYIVRGIWKSQRGAAPLPSGGDNYAADGPGFMVPPEALDILLPYLLPPGAA
ncbi:MAG: hypothetical protein NVS3B26_16540 [Mycobacteriales bacterium]